MAADMGTIIKAFENASDRLKLGWFITVIEDTGLTPEQVLFLRDEFYEAGRDLATPPFDESDKGER